jgi:hypothetical protein
VKVYNYNSHTKAFRFEEDADPDPLNPGCWLIPAHATTIEPPKIEKNEIICFNEIEQKWDIIKIEQPTIPYYILRAREYPSILEYIDGIVKNDHGQINKYIEKCRKVKEKYPKPLSNHSYEI